MIHSPLNGTPEKGSKKSNKKGGIIMEKTTKLLELEAQLQMLGKIEDKLNMELAMVRSEGVRTRQFTRDMKEELETETDVVEQVILANLIEESTVKNTRLQGQRRAYKNALNMLEDEMEKIRRKIIDEVKTIESLNFLDIELELVDEDWL